LIDTTLQYRSRARWRPPVRRSPTLPGAPSTSTEGSSLPLAGMGVRPASEHSREPRGSGATVHPCPRTTAGTGATSSNRGSRSGRVVGGRRGGYGLAGWWRFAQDTGVGVVIDPCVARRVEGAGHAPGDIHRSQPLDSAVDRGGSGTLAARRAPLAGVGGGSWHWTDRSRRHLPCRHIAGGGDDPGSDHRNRLRRQPAGHGGP
jgi:hypothetical protein